MKPKAILLLLFYLLFANGTESESTFSFILQYLKHFNIKHCQFLTCWEKSERNEFIQMLSESGIRYSFPMSVANIKLSLKEKTTLTTYGYISDFSCKKYNEIFHSEVDQTVMRKTYPWLIFLELEHFSQWQTFFENDSLRMDSDVKLAFSSKNKTQFYLFDVYNPGFQVGVKPVIKKSGFWNGSHLTINKNVKFYTQRKDMTDVQLRSGSVVLVENHTGTFEEYMLDSRHTEFDTMSKFHYPMFLLLAYVHNFSYTIVVEDKWFGNYQNGTDGGVGKLLYENKIDITCTGASQRPPRYDVYDYLMPSYHFRPCYIFRNPGSYDPLSNEFLKPFSSTVWYCIFSMTALISLCLKLFYKSEKKFTGSKSNYSWATAVLTSLSVIFQQDSSSFPTGNAGRIAFLVLQFLSILLYNYYTSSIISSLLSKPPEAFHTLDELGRSSLEIGIEDLPYTLTWFDIMNDSDVQYIYKHKVFPPGAIHLNIYEAEEGIAKVGKGGFAYHTQLDTGYPIIARTFDQDAICDIADIPMIPQVEAGMMLQKKSQYKELFHISLRKMKEVGLIHLISQTWESKKPECLSSARVIAVGFNQVFIAFLMLFVGILISLVLLLTEIMWFKLNLDDKLRKSFNKNQN